MKDSTENIDLLITAYLSGQLDKEGCKTLEEWVSESDDHQRYFEEMRNVWQVMHPAFKMEQIPVEKALKEVWKKTGYKKERHTIRFYHYWSRAAAILLLPLAGILIYLLATRQTVYQEISYQEVTALYGTKTDVTLPDGSLVCLNGGSKLKYPVIFKSGERNVYLNGEAYFEVHSDKKNPFVVHTEMLNVKATGTAFNVEGYANDTITAVTMVEGIVEVTLDKEQESLPLNPGQRINYNINQSDYKIEEVDTYKWCAWKDGKLIFRDESLGNVFRKIGQIYNADITVNDHELAQHVYRATFQGESLNEILRLIKLTVPMTYIERNNNTSADGNFTRRHIEVIKTEK